MRKRSRKSLRRAAAAVELAILSPLLLLLCVAAVDFARVYHDAQVITQCAQNGSLYAANPDWAGRTGYEELEHAILANASHLDPPPSVGVRYGEDAMGHHYVEVTVSHTFRRIFAFGGSAAEIPITRTARSRLFPSAIEDL